MAEKSERVRLERIGKLVTQLRELHTKSTELLEDLEELAAGSNATVEAVRRLATCFDTTWCARYMPGKSKGYAWNWAKDTRQLKRLVKLLGIDECEQRVHAYLRNTDAFYVNAGHNFNVFVGSINNHAARHERPPVETTCPDDPPCPFGTSAFKCHQRAQLNAMRRLEGRPLLGGS